MLHLLGLVSLLFWIDNVLAFDVNRNDNVGYLLIFVSYNVYQVIYIVGYILGAGVTASNSQKPCTYNA